MDKYGIAVVGTGFIGTQHAEAIAQNRRAALQTLCSTKRGLERTKRLAEKYGQGEAGKSLEEFDFSFNTRTPAQHIRDLATCRFMERKESIIFCGSVEWAKLILLRL